MTGGYIMARYQIRTGDDVFIEDVIDKMADNAWKILETWHFFEPAHPSRDDYRRFHDGIPIWMAGTGATYKQNSLWTYECGHEQRLEQHRQA
jgi:hypothetical protein